MRLRQKTKRATAALRLNDLLKQPERLLVTVLLITNMADILGLLLLTRSAGRFVWHARYFSALVIALPIYLFLLSVSYRNRFFAGSRFARSPGLPGMLEVMALMLLWPVLELGARLGPLLQPRRAANQARLFAAREELKQITAQSEREGSLTADRARDDSQRRRFSSG